MMERKMLIISLVLILSLTACNGLGNLKIRVVNFENQPVDDIYVGLYTNNFSKRIKFGYTTRGVVEFKGVNNGVYGLKIIGRQETRKTKVRIKSNQTIQAQIHLGKIDL